MDLRFPESHPIHFHSRPEFVYTLHEGKLVVDAVSQEVITSYTGLAMFVLGGVLLAFVVFPGQPSRTPR